MSSSTDIPVPLCPHCLEAVGERSHFCTACGMPLTSYATIAPMEQVWALGWLVSRLLSQPPSTFTVVGVWGLALPSLLIVMTVPFAIMVSMLNGDFDGLLALVVALLAAFCYVILAARVTLTYLRHRLRARAEEASHGTV